MPTNLSLRPPHAYYESVAVVACKDFAKIGPEGNSHDAVCSAPFLTPWQFPRQPKGKMTSIEKKKVMNAKKSSVQLWAHVHVTSI